MVRALITCMGSAGPGMKHLIFHPLKDYPQNQPLWPCSPSIFETQTLHINKLSRTEAEDWCQWKLVLLEINIWGLISVIPRKYSLAFPSTCSEPLAVLQWVCLFSLFFHLKKLGNPMFFPLRSTYICEIFPKMQRSIGNMGEQGWEIRKRAGEEWRNKGHRKHTQDGKKRKRTDGRKWKEKEQWEKSLQK